MRFISLIVPEFRIDLLEIINDQYLLFPKNVITMKYRNIELDTIYTYIKKIKCGVLCNFPQNVKIYFTFYIGNKLKGPPEMYKCPSDLIIKPHFLQKLLYTI